MSGEPRGGDPAEGIGADERIEMEPTRDDDAAVEAMYARVRADITRERGLAAWLRARPTPLRIGLLLSMGLLVSLGAVTALRGPALWAAAFGVGLATTVGLAGLGLLAVGAAFEPMYRRQRSGAARAVWLVGLMVAALGAIALAWNGRLGGLGSGRCLLVGLAVAVPVFGAALLLDRTPGRRGVVFAGVAAGLFGAIAAQLACPTGPLTHLIAEHFGVVALAALGLGGLARLRLSR